MARRGHALHHADDTAFISTPVFIVMAGAWIIYAMLSLVFPVGIACLLVFGLYAGYNYYALLHHVQHHRARRSPASAASPGSNAPIAFTTITIS